MYSSSDSCHDGNEGVGLPPIVLYGVNSCVIFGVHVHEGLFGESVVTIYEFDELDYACGGGCHRCLCLIWSSDYAQDVWSKSGMTSTWSLWGCAFK